MKYKCIISDFDGTITNDKDILIKQNVLDAINKYTNNNGKFVICTGRMYSTIMPICQSYKINGLLACYQGSSIRDIKTNEIKFAGGIDSKLAYEIYKYMLNDAVTIGINIDDILYFEKNSGFYDNYFKEIGPKEKYVKNYLCQLDNFEKFLMQNNKKIQKTVAICNIHQCEEISNKYNNKFGESILFNYARDAFVEGINKNCTKTSVVKFAAQYYNIGYDEILTIGDSKNDIPLLNGPWHGVAVGDACDELKKFAKEITVPIQDDPVKYIIDKYM